MNLEQLEAFVSVATLGGFTRASRQLHRTQPAISRRVKALEQSLGIDLFDRVNKDVHLTPEGKAFLPYAENAISTLKQGIEAISVQQSKIALKLAIVGTLADQHLATALTEFKTTGGEIELRTATSREVSTLVKHGEADLGIRYFEDFDTALTSTRIGFERLLLACSPTHALAGRTIKQGRQLADQNWIGFPFEKRTPDSFGHLLIRSLMNLGISEPHITEVDSLTAQKRLIEANYGIALLPVTSCEEELRSGALAEIKVSKLRAEQPIFAVYKSSSRNSELAAQFLKLIKSHISGITQK